MMATTITNINTQRRQQQQYNNNNKNTIRSSPQQQQSNNNTAVNNTLNSTTTTTATDGSIRSGMNNSSHRSNSCNDFSETSQSTSVILSSSSPRRRQQQQSTDNNDNNNNTNSNNNVATTMSIATEAVQTIFGISVGPCWGDYYCTYNRIRGRLYAVTNGILYYSNILGFERRLYLQYNDIISIELYKTTSIRIEIADFEIYIFKSFYNRVHVIQLLLGLKRLSDKRFNNTRRRSLSSNNNYNNNSNSIIKRNNSIELRSRSEGIHDDPYRLYDTTTSTTTTTNAEQAAKDVLEWDQQQQQQQRRKFDLQIQEKGNDNNNNNESNNLMHSTKSHNSFSNTTSTIVPEIPTPTPNRPRAVSDSVVRFFGFDFDDTNVAADTSFIQEESIDDDNDDDPIATAAAGEASVVPIFDLNEEWEKSVKQAESLEEVGIQNERLSCSLDIFFHNFLADNAPYSLDKFQRDTIKDIDVNATKWEKDDNDNNNNDNNNKKNETSQQEQEQQITTYTRTITFIHPIKSTVGPSQAKTKRCQIVRRYGNNIGITIENKTTVEGIPAADTFSVHDFWIIECAGPDAIILSTKFAPKFTKRTFFKGIIEKSVRKETKDWFVLYTNMLHEAIIKINNNSTTVNINNNGELTTTTINNTDIIRNEIYEMKNDIIKLLQKSFFPLIICSIIILFMILIILIIQLLFLRETVITIQLQVNEFIIIQNKLLLLLQQQQQQQKYIISEQQ